MTNSPVLNLFDFDANISNSHFLNLHILDYLLNRRSGYSIYGKGFVDIDGLIQEGDRVGIFRAAIEDSLIKMADFGLIEFENQSREGFATAHFVKITNTGTYYLEELAHTFKYLDLVWLDTPISDYDVVNELLHHVVELRAQKTERDILERFYRTEVFLDYLLKREQIEVKNKYEFQSSDLTRKVFMPGIIESYKDIESRK